MGVSSKNEDIALEVIKSIYATRDRVGTMNNTISAFASSDKRLANKLTNVKNDMDSGDETINAFFNNSFIREENFSLLNSLNEKGVLGVPVIDAMIRSNKEDTKITKKSRSLLVQPLITFSMGILIGNYLLSTGVDIVRSNPEFNIKLSTIYTFMADNLIVFSIAELVLFIPFLLYVISFIILKTGGIYRYLYKANVMAYFLRKAKTPFSGVFQKLKTVIPKMTKAYNVIENMEEEIKFKSSAEVLKEYLALYPFYILTTKMPQITRGEDTDVFLELSEDSLVIYNEFTNKISSSMPLLFLVLTLAYVGFSLFPLFSFIGAAMSQSTGG